MHPRLAHVLLAGAVLSLLTARPAVAQLPRLQPFRAISSQRVKPNAVVVLDTSGSMRQPAWCSSDGYPGNTVGTDCEGGAGCTAYSTSYDCPKCLLGHTYSPSGGGTCTLPPSEGGGTYPAYGRTSSRIAEAKRALGNILAQISTSVNLGLMTYDQAGYSAYRRTGWGGWTVQMPTPGTACPTGPTNHSVTVTLTEGTEYALTLCNAGAGNAIRKYSTSQIDAPDSVVRIYPDNDSTTLAENDDTSTPAGVYTNCQAESGDASAASTAYYTPSSTGSYKVCVAGKTGSSDGKGTLRILARLAQWMEPQRVPGFEPSVTAPASATIPGLGDCALSTLEGKQGRWRPRGRGGSRADQYFDFEEMTSCRWRGGGLRCSNAGRDFDLRGVAYACWMQTESFTSDGSSTSRVFGPTDDRTPYASRGPAFSIATGLDAGTWSFAVPSNNGQNALLGTFPAAQGGRLRVQASTSGDAAVQAAKLDAIGSWLQPSASGGLSASGATPIGPSLYQSPATRGSSWQNNAYQYYQCLEQCTSPNANGCSTSGFECDPLSACRDSYVVLVTDGAPTEPSSDATYCVTDQAACRAAPGASSCRCRAVKAAYNLRQGTPSVKTFVIGFSADVSGNADDRNMLRNIAKAGGTCLPGRDDVEGCVYFAGDQQQLVDALKAAFNRISGEFSTSPVSTATGSRSTVASNYALLTATRYPAWEGELTAYDLLSPNLDAQGRAPVHFKAGEELKVRPWCERKVFSWNVTNTALSDSQDPPRFSSLPPNTAVPFSTWTAGPCLPAHANGAAVAKLFAKLKEGGFLPATVPAPNELEASNMVRFILGDPLMFGQASGAPQWKLGPIMHSTPIVVGESAEDAGRFPGRPGLAYVGSSYGLVHAFWLESGMGGRTKGGEAFAFAPPRLLGSMYEIYTSQGESSDESKHVWGVASSAHATDICVAGCGSATPTWRTLLVFGLGAGGPAYYALDVSYVAGTDGSPLSTPYCAGAEPNDASRCVFPRWSTDDRWATPRLGHTDLASGFSPLLGEGWSVPGISEVGGRRVVVMGSGYGTDGEKGQHLVVANAATGTLLENRRIGGGPPASPQVEYGLLADVPLVKYDPLSVTESPAYAVVADPGGRIHAWVPQIDSGSDNSPTLVADLGVSKPFLYGPAVFHKQAGGGNPDEVIIGAGTSSFDLPEGSPETYLYILARRGGTTVTVAARKISDLCKTDFTRNLDSVSYCASAENRFNSTTRLISAPKILVNSTTRGVACNSAQAQNSGNCVLQVAFPVYEPAPTACETGSSYLIVLEAVLFPALQAEHAMTIDLGERLRSSGFTVGAGGQSLVVGGTGGVTPTIRGSGSGGSSFRGTRTLGWREI